MRTQCDKKLGVMTVVQVIYEVTENREFRQDGDNIWGSDELKE